MLDTLQQRIALKMALINEEYNKVMERRCNSPKISALRRALLFDDPQAEDDYRKYVEQESGIYGSLNDEFHAALKKAIARFDENPDAAPPQDRYDCIKEAPDTD